MMKRIAWVILSLLASGYTHAASFDCTKAATKAEKLICGNAELSSLDEELNAAYRAALHDAGQSDSAKQAQKKWITIRNACVDADCVKLAYENRLKEMPASNRMPLGIADDFACRRFFQDIREGVNVQFIEPSYRAETAEKLEHSNAVAPCKVSNFIETIEFVPQIRESIQDLPKEEQAQYGRKWTMTKDFRVYQVNFAYGGSARILYGGGTTAEGGEKADFTNFVVLKPYTCEAQLSEQVYDVVNHPDASFGIVRYGREPLIYETKYYEREKHYSLRFFRLGKGAKNFESVCDFPVDNVDFLSHREADKTPH